VRYYTCERVEENLYIGIRVRYVTPVIYVYVIIIHEHGARGRLTREAVTGAVNYGNATYIIIAIVTLPPTPPPRRQR